MSEKQEKKRRYNMRLEFIYRFEMWLKEEPPMILFWRWRRWKRNRPIFDGKDWHYARDFI